MNHVRTTIKLLICILAISWHACPAWSGTFYVDINNTKANDSNSGSQEAPWKTIAKASDTLKPGDMVIVNEGTYNETLTSTRSGAAGMPITFKGQGKANIIAAKIDHDYITLDGFSFLTNDAIIDINHANYCQIVNNTLKPGWITMHFLNSTDSPTGCLIKGNHLSGMSQPSGDYVVIQLYGSKHIVEGNEIGPASDIDAFRFWGHDNIIRNNYVHNVTFSPGSKAHMDIFQTFSLNGWSAHDITIENNRFIDFAGQLCMTSTDGAVDTHDIILRNNVFANIGENANIGIRNMSFLNNTFYNVGVFASPNIDWSDSTNTTFKNNIFIGINGYNLAYYDANIFNHPASEPWFFENNFISTLSGKPLLNFDTKEQVRGINGGIINFTSIANKDFSIKTGSIVIDKGVTLTGFNYDQMGTTRPKGTAWDIGAYEFTSGSNIELLAPTGLEHKF
jgi:hypothetical protein